jgi:hypothetical protein
MSDELTFIVEEDDEQELVIRGPKGDKGAPGKDGADGIDGRDGVDGTDGKDGKNGLQGLPGKDGKDGTDGRDGINGLNGKDGLDGKDGTSLDFKWEGTSLGIKRSDQKNFKFSDLGATIKDGWFGTGSSRTYRLNTSGVGTSLINASKSNAATLKGLVAGSGVSITDNGDSLTIASSGGGGGGATQVFVQPAEPTVSAGTSFMWVQTGLGDGTDFMVYAGTGL